MKWSLRAKLFVFVPVLALLPWLGWQTLDRLQQFATRAQTEALAILAETLADELHSLPPSTWRQFQGLSGEPVSVLANPPTLDGFVDDWIDAPILTLSQMVQLRVGQVGDQVYFVVEVKDSSRVYRRPGSAESSDRLVVTVLSDEGDHNLTIAPEGPGYWLPASSPPSRIGTSLMSGYWWELADGYRFEGRLGAETLQAATAWRLSVVDVSLQQAITRSYAIPVRPMHPALQRRVEAFAGDSRQVIIADRSNRLLAISAGQPARFDLAAEYPIAPDAASPGIVRVQAQSDQVVASASRALIQLAWQTLAVFLVVMIGLSVFAGRLTERIGRLRREFRAHLDARGRLAEPRPLSALTATDELGELARDLTQVMADLRRYTQFLERIPRTLRHELSNPMSTVQTSLELLADETDPMQQARLRAAAERGIAKLDSTLSRVTEAVSLEDALREDVLYSVDLRKLLQDYGAIQAEQHPRLRWKIDVPDAPVVVEAHALRLEQLLDKLIDNALDFTPDQGRIWLRVRDHLTAVSLSVENEGVGLVSAPSDDLFQLFSSSRQDATGVHLGLGLYIVRAIAESFGASPQIESTGRGVRVTLQGFRRPGGLTGCN